MRVNVYSQELTSEVELVSKPGRNEKGDPETFYAVRLYLISPDALHRTATDDDRSAITLWLPKSGDRRRALFAALAKMSEIVYNEIH